MGFLMDPR